MASIIVILWYFMFFRFLNVFFMYQLVYTVMARFLSVSGTWFVKNTCVVRSGPMTLFIAVMLFEVSLHAQNTNIGTLMVSSGTTMVSMDAFYNKEGAVLSNNGRFMFSDDIRNDGLFTYMSDLGEREGVFLNGVQSQKIDGDQMIEVSKIEIDNSEGIVLENDIVVRGEMVFSAGVINGKELGGIVLFDVDASFYGPDDISHIDGTVYRYGGRDFEFPVGNSGLYRPIFIDEFSTSDGIFSAQYFSGSSDMEDTPHNQKAFNIESISSSGYWVLERLRGGGETTVSLPLVEGEDLDYSIMNDRGRLCIVRWDMNYKRWVFEGGVVDDVRNVVRTAGPISEFGLFALAVAKAETVEESNLITPNDRISTESTVNFFLIESIEDYPNNRVEIYDRWGSKVFDVTGYDNSNNVFNGISNTGISLFGNGELPSDIYFYVIQFTNGVEPFTRTGYLFLGK